MIPTVIVLGLLLGRWWWAALPLATAGWPILLMSVGDISIGQIPVAAFLGFANAAVGVVIAQSPTGSEILKPTRIEPATGR